MPHAPVNSSHWCLISPLHKKSFYAGCNLSFCKHISKLWLVKVHLCSHFLLSEGCRGPCWAGLFTLLCMQPCWPALSGATFYIGGCHPVTKHEITWVVVGKKYSLQNIVRWHTVHLPTWAGRSQVAEDCLHPCYLPICFLTLFGSIAGNPTWMKNESARIQVPKRISQGMVVRHNNWCGLLTARCYLKRIWKGVWSSAEAGTECYFSIQSRNVRKTKHHEKAKRSGGKPHVNMQEEHERAVRAVSFRVSSPLLLAAKEKSLLQWGGWDLGCLSRAGWGDAAPASPVAAEEGSEAPSQPPP